MAGLRFLLDTNAIIALQRQNVSLMQLLSTATDVFVPVIAIGELYYGAYKSQRVTENHRRVGEFVSNRVVLDVDATTTDFYGQIKQQLRAKGRPIPENDLWIASLSLQYTLILITEDAHFDAVEGLKKQSW